LNLSQFEEKVLIYLATYPNFGPANYLSMLLRLAYLLTAFLLNCSADGQSAIPILRLKNEIDSVLSGQKGEFAVAFKDLSTNKELYIHEKEIFHAASTMKTPVLIEIYRQATMGKFLLSDSIQIKNEFQSIADSSLFSLNPSDDSETELYNHLGEKRSIADLLYLMITQSSNFSTNLLIQLVKAENVTRTMRLMGAKDILVLRGVEDQKAFDKGMNNTVTAYDLMLIYEKMATGKAVSPSASEAMIKILLDQHFNEIIPALLPPTVKVAHKTGSFAGVHHDSGIVFLADGRKYLLVILSKNLENENDAVTAMAMVSKMIYNFLNPSR
jgi:beta-lactamase class A